MKRPLYESEAQRLVKQLLEGTDDVDDALNDILGPDPQKQFDQTLKASFERTDVPTVPLGDLLDQLPPMILDQIMEIVNSSANDREFMAQIEPLVQRFEGDLAEVGVIPSYLARGLQYARKHLRGQL